MVGSSEKHHLKSKKSEEQEESQGAEKYFSLNKKKARREGRKGCDKNNAVDLYNGSGLRAAYLGE